jgi:hypothetical protein
MACQIGSVPGKEEHEDVFGNVSETSGEGDFEIGDVRHQKYCSDRPRRGAALIHWVAVRVEPDH